MQACVVDRNPQCDSHAVMAHGRLEGLRTLITAILVFMSSMDLKFSANFICIVTLIGFALLLYAFMTYLPFYKPVVNQLHCAAAILLLWAAMCEFILLFRHKPEVP